MLNSECYGIVLAGGLSSRMGKNKATLKVGSDDMLALSKQLLVNAGAQKVLVSGDGYDIADTYKQAGPMGGIYSVLQHLKTKITSNGALGHALNRDSEKTNCASLLLLPVDLPLLTPDTLQQLKVTGELSGKATYFQSHSLPLYLPINGYSELFFEKAFKQFSENKTGKGPSIKALLNSMPSQSLPLTSRNELLNTNTPQQWQEAQTLLNARAQNKTQLMSPKKSSRITYG